MFIIWVLGGVFFAPPRSQQSCLNWVKPFIAMGLFLQLCLETPTQLLSVPTVHLTSTKRMRRKNICTLVWIQRSLQCLLKRLRTSRQIPKQVSWLLFSFSKILTALKFHGVFLLHKNAVYGMSHIKNKTHQKMVWSCTRSSGKKTPFLNLYGLSSFWKNPNNRR